MQPNFPFHHVGFYTFTPVYVDVIGSQQLIPRKHNLVVDEFCWYFPGSGNTSENFYLPPTVFEIFYIPEIRHVGTALFWKRFTDTHDFSVTFVRHFTIFLSKPHIEGVRNQNVMPFRAILFDRNTFGVNALILFDYFSCVGFKEMLKISII